MTFEHQVKEFARAINHYSISFSIEPSVVLCKPFSVVQAAYYLALVSQSETAQSQGIIEQVEYSQQGSQRNVRGDPERVHEQAIIPLTHVADNPQAQTKLQDMINRFK